MLVGRVSSRRRIDEFSTRTISGLAGEVLILIGIVAGQSEALYDEILSIQLSGCGNFSMDAKQFRVESCLHV